MGTFTRVAARKDIPEGKALAVTVGSQRIALFNIGGKFYAIDDECSHAGGSLSEGEVEGTVVTCPWHGAKFELTSGAVAAPPAFSNQSAYKVQIDGDDIKLELP